jgi:ABC-2 type transport system ATP-binding protein
MSAPVPPKPRAGGPVPPKPREGGPVPPKPRAGGPVPPKPREGGPVPPKPREGGPVSPKPREGGPVSPKPREGGPVSPKPREGGPAIETAGLGRDYQDVRALDELSIVIDRGSTVGVLGPNGAGKTTTLLMLATLLAPTRGKALVFGHDITRERAAIRRRLGLVFQEPSIDGLLTVEENLRFAAGLMGMGGTGRQRAVSEALVRTGLVEQASRPGRRLSGGFRRLTDIARATVHGPDLLLLDEPTSGLDPEHRDRVWALLEAERRTRGVTVVFSTHYLAEAESCDRVFMLASGRLVAADTPASLRATVGEEVVEVEGPDAERAARSLESVADVRMSVRTERGYRIGISGARDALSTVVGAAPHLARVGVRAATLEDVYFARTQGQGLTAQASGPRAQGPDPGAESPEPRAQV